MRHTPNLNRIAVMMRAVAGHTFLTDDVSIVDDDVPPLAGHRQVTDAHLLALARRHGTRVVTFDAGLCIASQADATSSCSPSSE